MTVLAQVALLVEAALLQVTLLNRLDPAVPAPNLVLEEMDTLKRVLVRERKVRALRY